MMYVSQIMATLFETTLRLVVYNHVQYNLTWGVRKLTHAYQKKGQIRAVLKLKDPITATNNNDI